MKIPFETAYRRLTKKMIPAPALASRQQALVPQTAEFIKDLVAQPGAMIVTVLLFSVHFVDLGERVRVRL